MKKFLFLALILFTISLNAQTHYLGVKAGVNFSNINYNTDPAFEDFQSRTGVNAGITYDFLFMKFLSCGAELSFNQRGDWLDVLFTNEIGEPIGEGKLHYNYDYIQLPLKAGVIFGNKFTFFANIGLVPALNVISKMKVPTDIEGQSEKNTKDKVQSFDFAGLAEVGAEMKFAGRFKAFISASYQHSFTPFNMEDYFVDLEMKHYGISVSGGIKFAIKN